ncbi:MAG: translocation/assembly module TamB, partial [Novosphingobium sp.]|nr:translocation/assembly module TamB [Novosphingobium sp.]
MTAENPITEEDPLTGEQAPPPGPARRNWRRYVITRGAALLAAAVVGLFALVLALDSQIGHRFVIDRIAELSPRSGLKIEVGRIEGSLYDEAILHDIVLRDPDGVFMTVPEAELAWRPLSWLRSGLDIRKLVLHRGYLARLPRLRPGDPDAPLLPEFDIRVDRFELDRLTVGEKVFGQRRRIDLLAQAEIRQGRLLLNVDSRLGGADRLLARVDAEPDRDKFDLFADYAAPRGGLLAGLAGADSAIRARMFGKGKWSDWKGALSIRQDGQRFAAFELGNRAGRYTALGQVYPDGLLTGAAKAAVGRALSLRLEGTYRDSVLSGKLWSAAAAFKANAGGRIDFARDRVDGVVTKIAVGRPELVLAAPELEGVRLSGTLDGPFRDLSFAHELRIDRLESGTVVAQGLRTAGIATWDGSRFVLPLNLTAQRVVTGNKQLDPRFAGGSVRGDLVLAGTRLTSDNLAIDLRGLMARLALRGDIATGGYALAGPVTARGFALPNLGLVDAEAKILASIGAGSPWKVAINASGRMRRIDNATLASISGGNIRFSGGVNLAQNAPILFRDARINASKLSLRINGRRLPGGRTTFAGGGRHVDYGPFTVEAAVGSEGPRAVLVFASPLPAAGLRDVRVALAPIANGFRLDTTGGSTLGPF